MNDNNIKSSSISFVGIGHFSPPQFSPYWLQSENLIRNENVDKKKVFIAPDISHFSIPGITFRVYPESLEIATDDARYFQPIKDLVMGIFSILDRTPIYRFGVNHGYHFQVESEADLNKLRDSLSPKKFWEKNLESVLLKELTIQAKNKYSSEEGDNAKVTVARSNKVRHGVYVHINNHFEVIQKNSFDQTNYLVETIKSHWLEMEKGSKEILKGIMELSS